MALVYSSPNLPGQSTRFLLCASIAILFLLVPVTPFPHIQNHSVSPASVDVACDFKNLKAQADTEGQNVNIATAILFAKTSHEFTTMLEGFASSFSGANNGWTYDSSCKVSWTGIAINFLTTSPNGSRYTLTISENPELGVVYSAVLRPLAYAAISPTCSSPPCYWSGYAVSGNSNNNQQIYQAEAYWYVPKLYGPPTNQVDCASTSNLCELSEWVGLTDSTCRTCGKIVQAGVDSTWWSPRTPQDTYWGWTEIYPSQGEQSCLSTDTVSGGDHMESDIENQLVHNGQPGNNYYIYLDDWTASWLCTPATQPQSVSFTPYYAAAIAERTLPSYYHLAKFQSFNFTNFTNDASNLWSDYNNGYGFGVYMKNNGYTETTTYAMIHNSGSYYGNFKLSWVTSSGT